MDPEFWTKSSIVVLPSLALAALMWLDFRRVYVSFKEPHPKTEPKPDEGDNGDTEIKWLRF